MDKEFFMNNNNGGASGGGGGGIIPSPSPLQLQLQFDEQFISSSTIMSSTWHSLTTQPQDYLLSTPPPTDHFESALSSMVTSPAATTASNSALSTHNFMIRELIGKLGNICNSNDIVLPNYFHDHTSCYTTPLSSPPKIGLNLPAMPGDPGFADRAARFSSFGSSRSFNGRTPTTTTTTTNPFEKINKCNIIQSPLLKEEAGSQVLSNNNKQVEVCNNSRENSSTSGQNQAAETGSTCRKRKASISKGKGKETDSAHPQFPTISNKVGGKRSKSEESNGKEEENKGGGVKDNNEKGPEAPKDYIHVRARRGQATDSHSLAERVRREKISERMKVLQDLVPGCNRVTGKALMLDEIINYVQSLQRQVEFLSMKLSTINPRIEMNMENLFRKDEIQPNCSLTHPMYPTTTMVPNQYGHGQPHLNPLGDSLPNNVPSSSSSSSMDMDPLNPTLNHNHLALHLLSFSNCLPQLPSSLCEGDLQSIVGMGFGQEDDGFEAQTSQGPNDNPRQMKEEL